MEPSVGTEFERFTVADRVWEEVVEIYGHNPRINHTRFIDLSSSGRDERAEALSKIVEIVPREKLVGFIPIALWPDLDRAQGNWDTVLLKILLRCLKQSTSESRRKSYPSTLPTNVEVPAFGQLSSIAALLHQRSQVKDTGVAFSGGAKARDEMSGNHRPKSESRLQQLPPSSSPPVATKDNSTKARTSAGKAPSPLPPPPPPVLDADEELKHQIAIARAKRNYRKILAEESTEQERTSLEGKKCLLEEVEFDLEALRAEEELEDVYHETPFEKDFSRDPGISRKRRIGALEIERAERRYGVAKAVKLDGKV